MQFNGQTGRRAALIASALLLGASTALAQVNFTSTQLRPVDEAAKVRNVILKGVATPVSFIPEDDGPFLTRILAEAKAGKGSIGMVGALDTSLSTLSAAGALDDLDPLARDLSAGREFTPGFASAGKFDGRTRTMIPWMYTSYVMVANKKALPYLPKGADLNALTYEQLKQWAKAIKDATGEPRLGFPAGPKGLMHRFFQGYLYPSYTGGMARTFRNADAQKMWADFRDLWQYVSPRSTSYGFMEEPLSSGEIWIAFDHMARLLPALKDKPADFVAFPAPAGPKGRGYMLVLAGLSIPKTAPDKAAAAKVIDHLTKPATQALTLLETGFYPVVKVAESQLPPGIALAARALDAQSGAKDARVAAIPVGLGARGGEFNKIYLDTFERIVLRREDIPTVLKAQGAALKALLDAAAIPCWAPDVAQGPHCSVD